MENSLYDQILAIATEYMGVAAEDYVNRRIRIVQGGGDPREFEASKLGRLAAGIDMTAKGYMSSAKAQEFRQAILALQSEP